MKDTIVTGLKFNLVVLILIVVAGCNTPTDPVEHTVTFNANGGTVSPPDVTVKNGGTVASLPTPVKTSGDTIFWGWFTKNGAGGDWGNPFTAITPVTTDIIVYARWESAAPPTPYTITFNADGGTVTPTNKQVLPGDPAGDLPIPTKSNNTFGGWYTGQNGGGSVFTSATIVTGDITVYAKWTASGGNNGNNGETNIGSSAHLGQTITISNMPVYMYDWETGTLAPMNHDEPIELERSYNEYIFDEPNSLIYELELTIVAGKISVTIPAPKPEELVNIITAYSQFTANPSGVKGLTVNCFGDYGILLDLSNKDDPNLHTAFVYVDRNVQIIGISGDFFWDVSLIQGWNTVILNYQTRTASLGTLGNDYVWVYGRDVERGLDSSAPGPQDFNDNEPIVGGTISGATIDGQVPGGGCEITYLDRYIDRVNSVFVEADGTWEMDISSKTGNHGTFLLTLYADTGRKNYFNQTPYFNYGYDNRNPLNITLDARNINTRQITVTLTNATGEVTINPSGYAYFYLPGYEGLVTFGNGTSTMKISVRNDYLGNNDYYWFRVVSGSSIYITKGRVNVTTPVMLDINQMYKLN